MENPYDAPQSTTDHGAPPKRPFTPFELLVVIGIVVFLVALLLPAISQPHVYPIRMTVRNCLLQIQLAAVISLATEGTAPARVEDLKTLVKNGYIDASLDGDEMLRKMIASGTDYWGNSLRLEPLPDKRGFVVLTSPGPDGQFDNSAESDDISIEYQARIE